MNEKREFNLDKLDIIGILKDIIKNIWVIILAGAACWLLVTSSMKLTYQPVYSSTATFAIMAKGSTGSNLASLTTASSMADVLSEIFQSKILRTRVSKELGVDNFEGEIQSEVIKETNLLRLTVTASDPKKAYFGIRAVINNYRSVSDYVFGNAVMEIISSPQIPLQPSNPLVMGRTRKMAAGIGMLTACLMIGFMSVMRNTVKNRRTAIRRLDGKYLGMAPHEEKNRTLKSRIHNYNKSVLITNAICSFNFSEAIEKLAVRTEYHMRKNHQKILMVTSIAENEGKTTVAANLAISLASKGYRVLIVDLDLRKPAVHKIFEKKVTKEEGLGLVLKDSKKMKDILEFDEKNHVFLTLNSSSYSDSQDILSSKKIRSFLEMCRNYMDYIIIDTPPAGVSSDTEIISSYADASMLVVRQDWVDIRDINDGIDILKQGKGEFIGYVLNNVYDRRKQRTAHSYSSIAVTARETDKQ